MWCVVASGDYPRPVDKRQWSMPIRCSNPSAAGPVASRRGDAGLRSGLHARPRRVGRWQAYLARSTAPRHWPPICLAAPPADCLRSTSAITICCWPRCMSATVRGLGQPKGVWVGEDTRPKAGYRIKDPDAWLLDAQGRTICVIESAGRYSTQQIESFHEHCVEYGLPYQLW